MIFEGSPDDFFAFQHSLDSPDLRPISLPMSGHDKALDGMINLQNAAISFPESNAFAQYAQQPYMTQIPAQHTLNSSYHEIDPEYYSDSDFGYSIEYDSKAMTASNHFTPANNATMSKLGELSASSRKRKPSPSLEYVQPQPQKRATITSVHVQDPEGEYYDVHQPSPYSPYGAGLNIHTNNNSPRPGHHYSASNASQVSLAAPSPHTPAWSPSFTTVKTEHSPRAPMTPVQRATSPVAFGSAIPKLVRTSTIPQQGSPSIGVGMNTGMHTHTFNPYAMYPQNKASLRLKGDLDAVALEWSKEELEASRKLIVFTRHQNGSAIDAEFKAVPQDEWQRSDITVNCIWWKERKEAFVTSVDTIALLEQLVAVRFTVEEKNRIRRNLEGFRPLTVSKAKADSEDFFKVIMGFPNPKPRNIEKDVKVFPWKILAHALKKIISKYSASYSSTASTLVTPAASVYASTEHSTEYQLAPSPGHEMISHNMPPCTLPISSYEQQLPQGRLSAPIPSGIYDMSVHVSNMVPTYEALPAHGYNMLPVASHPMHNAQHAMTAPVYQGQPAWSFDPYVTGEGVMYMPPASAPPSAYPLHHGPGAEYAIAPAYRHAYHH